MTHYNKLRFIFCFILNLQGCKLLIEDGIGCLVKINNNVFVHGNLKDDRLLIDYNYFNKNLNDTNLPKDDYEYFLDILNKTEEVDGFNSILWDRSHSDQEITKRNSPGVKNDTFCKEIKNQLDKLNAGSDLRLFVGHCIQSYSTIFGGYNRTFTKIIDDGNVEIIEPPARTSTFDLSNNFLFGITMECENMKDDNHLVYRVDVGSSRAFDSKNTANYIKNKMDEKQHFFSRTPQVLEIYDNDKKIRIIRSKIGNTRKFQPRSYYEENIKRAGLTDLDLSDPYYKKKYLKYKQKYLQLKNK